MKIYKKIFTGFIVVVTILGLVSFSFPVQNLPKPRPQSSSFETEENYAASLAPVSPASTSTTSTTSTSSTPKSAETSFEEMFGFSDLGKESDLVGKMGTGSSTDNAIDDIFKELNQ